MTVLVLELKAPQAIEHYLKQQNRPYSAIDIFNNLHKEYGKTAVVKGCEILTEQKKIKEKTYGKQKVYVADQAQFPDVAESEIAEMGQQITRLTEQLRSYQTEVKAMESELKTLTSALTTEQATKELASIDNECVEYRRRLATLQSGSNSVTPQQKDKIYASHTKYIKEWRKRKRLTNDILDAILEGYPNTKKQLYEEIGIETDEDYKVKPPDLP